MRRGALIPGSLALLPEYASQIDPIPELRDACREVVEWLGDSVALVGTEQACRVGQAVLDARHTTAGEVESWLVMMNGSASRDEQAPGAFDPRARAFDHALGAALTAIDGHVLLGTEIDRALARDLFADIDAYTRLADLVSDTRLVSVDYDADPFGVQYWVLRWAS